MEHDLLVNLDQIHTTELGLKRTRKNLNLSISLDNNEVIDWCKQQVKNAPDIINRGKNWYIYTNGVIITINAGSYTIITAHKLKAKR